MTVTVGPQLIAGILATAFVVLAWVWPYKYTSTGYGQAAEGCMSFVVRAFATFLIVIAYLIWLVVTT